MPKKLKMDTPEFWISKIKLGILSAIFGILAIVGAATHMLIGAVFMLLFMASFGLFIGIEELKQWFKK